MAKFCALLFASTLFVGHLCMARATTTSTSPAYEETTSNSSDGIEENATSTANTDTTTQISTESSTTFDQQKDTETTFATATTMAPPISTETEVTTDVQDETSQSITTMDENTVTTSTTDSSPDGDETDSGTTQSTSGVSGTQTPSSEMTNETAAASDQSTTQGSVPSGVSTSMAETSDVTSPVHSSPSGATPMPPQPTPTPNPPQPTPAPSPQETTVPGGEGEGQNGDDAGDDTGKIVGIFFGVVIGLIILVVIVYFVLRKQKQERARMENFHILTFESRPEDRNTYRGSDFGVDHADSEHEINRRGSTLGPVDHIDLDNPGGATAGGSRPGSAQILQESATPLQKTLDLSKTPQENGTVDSESKPDGNPGAGPTGTGTSSIVRPRPTSLNMSQQPTTFSVPRALLTPDELPPKKSVPRLLSFELKDIGTGSNRSSAAMSSEALEPNTFRGSKESLYSVPPPINEGNKEDGLEGSMSGVSNPTFEPDTFKGSQSNLFSEAPPNSEEDKE